MSINLFLLAANPFFLIFIAIISGILIGKIEVYRCKLGSSGSLFTGLIIGWYVYEKYIVPYESSPDSPYYIKTIMENGLIPQELFTFSLILFVAAVGLLAAKDIKNVFKMYGVKLLLLGFLIPFAGALVIYTIILLHGETNLFGFLGAYVGGLTSSPGLAAALESAVAYGSVAENMVGLGYAIGYIPGAFVVVITVQIIPTLFKIDLAKEKQVYSSEFGEKVECTESIENIDDIYFDLFAFFIVCLAGLIIGKLNFSFGLFKDFHLGTTGGVIVSSLVLGYIGKVGKLSFRMHPKVLGALKDISLYMYLSSVGLKYGYNTVNSVTGLVAKELLVVAVISSIIAVFIGFLIGRYILKINWIILSGALCGGMTSTPGLGAAIDAAKTDDVVAGYGATYPFALMGMIMFTIVLITLV